MDKYQGAPECRGTPSTRHENFRRKLLKGDGRGRIREGKERGLPGYFVQGPRSF